MMFLTIEKVEMSLLGYFNKSIEYLHQMGTLVYDLSLIAVIVISLYAV